MPGHLPPQLSLRLSDTGSKHGEPLRSPTKGEGCSILLAIRHPSVCQSKNV